MFFSVTLVRWMERFSSTDDRRQFITLSLQLCLRHDGRDAARCAFRLRQPETCFNKQESKRHVLLKLVHSMHGGMSSRPTRRAPADVAVSAVVNVNTYAIWHTGHVEQSVGSVSVCMCTDEQNNAASTRGVYTRGEMVRDAPWRKVGGFFC